MLIIQKKYRAKDNLKEMRIKRSSSNKNKKKGTIISFPLTYFLKYVIEKKSVKNANWKSDRN